MPDANFINPLLNPILTPVLIRTAILLGVGFLVLFAIARFKFSALSQSHLGKRYLGWLILTPIYLAGIFLGGIPALIVLFLFMAAAILEIARMASLPRAYTVLLILLSAWSVIVAGFFTQYFYTLPLLYFIGVTLVAIRINDAKQGLNQAAVSLFSAIWIIFGLSHAVLLGHLNNTLDDSKSLLLLIIFATSLSDIGAYIIGKFFHKISFLDKYKIASNISPNKTYIGIVGHVAGALLGVWFLYFILGGYLPPYQWLIVSVLIGVFGLVGGLTNSLFKRFYAVKDSSQLIPGHGGVLDRIDSMSRVIVILYYYFLLVL
ncbi:MAG: hypothetical protein COU11_02680 [Candidatus Harrisonbacteria bacterium CG10_big_fil_rev_8_21_14_0_10_49_15]|uniref:Phosphatidate cytidylyltransferase n=1 Tax=Candidatus Harrisonbacteria bacterium CG10_big_fil_rev_8_21_14_0_10_49_15 TaxID=1974587 RepID=A0A2H0UL29_9BACT|nr:MAG: hypothetical protein COU11_02680 [Candidatus Harrisonbacteria bacterium CG10_big_fil_rev_8_21_14_0_10_49_15]